MNKTVEIKDLSDLELRAIGFDKMNLINSITNDLQMINSELNRRASLPKVVEETTTHEATQPVEETLKDIVENEEKN